MTHRNVGSNGRLACGLIMFALEFAALNVAAAGVLVHAPDRRGHVDESARTPQAVIAVDDHWSLAEFRGNTAWLDSLLLPNYRSIRADGSVWDKKTLLAHVAKFSGHGSEKLKEFDARLKTHPIDESVIMHGSVAILLFSDPKNGRIRGSNVFIRENGRWHALYSQQTGVK